MVSRKSYGSLGIISATVIFMCALNYARLTVAARTEAGADVSVLSYYRYGISPNVIVYDVWGVGPSASQAEILGGFMRFADQLKDRKFLNVVLAYRGSSRFYLSGDDFHTIGQEFDFQNPVFTLRTFPEKLKRPNGMPAFDSWSGGLLGVLNAQMEDLNELGRQWYLNDLIN